MAGIWRGVVVHRGVARRGWRCVPNLAWAAISLVGSVLRLAGLPGFEALGVGSFRKFEDQYDGRFLGGLD